MSDVFSGFDSVNPRNPKEITSQTFSNASEVDSTPNQDVFSGFERGEGDRYNNEVTIKDFETTDAEEAADKDNNDSNNRSNKTTSFGRRGTKRRGGVLRYPLEMMTDHTDYLQIDIKKYVPLGNYVSRPGDSRRYVTGNNFTDRAGRRTTPNLSTKPLINDGTILLPIPSELKDVNSVNVGTSELNGLAAAGISLIEQGSDDISGANLFSKEGRNQLASQLQNTFGEFKQDVAGGVGDPKAALNLLNKQFASQIVGVFGTNVTANQLLNRSNGEIINPNMELLFNGPAIRNFRFNFKMTPRNEKEAQQIKLIIRAFKRNMAPQANGGTLNSGSFFLKTPNVFELRYRTGRRNHPFLNRFKQCFLSNMSVRYTGEGVYSTYEDGTPVSMILDLEFKETQPIYDVDYDERPGTEAVGY